MKHPRPTTPVNHTHKYIILETSDIPVMLYDAVSNAASGVKFSQSTLFLCVSESANISRCGRLSLMSQEMFSPVKVIDFR